jgi:integrase/recombinase XerD
VVRSGKGEKDRAIPLLPDIATRLQNFIREMKPDEKVFNLKATSIGNKIRRFAQKAGLDNFHTHTIRHKFATDLLNRGANIKHVQELLGHTRLDTTQVYLAVTSQGLRDVVNLLDSNSKQIRFPKPKIGVPAAWTPEDGFEL